MSRPVVLVFPDVNPTYFGLRGGAAFKRMFRLPPLGLLYLSSTLGRAGFPAVVVNEEVGPRLVERLDWLRGLDPLFVGFHANILNEPIVCEDVERVRRETGVPVVVGGPGCFRAEPYLRAGAEYACRGEGEATIVELAERFAGRRAGTAIAGTSRLVDGALVGEPARPGIADLDSIPFPAWLENPEIGYYSRYGLTAREPLFTMTTTRGCAMHCDYCGSPAHWQHTVRRRSVENVIEELTLLRDRLGMRYVEFYDDIFIYGGEWEARFCEAVLRSGLRFRWGCIAYPKKVDPELLRLMRRAGCVALKIGVQSADAGELRSIHRNPNTVERGLELIRNARRAGMMTSADFILGLPGATEESMQRTVDYMFELDPTILKLAELEFYPGTPFYERRHERLCEVPAAWMEDLHRRTIRRFYARPGKLAEVFGFMLRNPATFRHAASYVDFMVRHVLFGRGENQPTLEANRREGVPTGSHRTHRTIETAGPRWIVGAGRGPRGGSDCA